MKKTTSGTDMGKRAATAHTNFVRSLVENNDLSSDDAEAILALYHREKLVKLDVAIGAYIVKHGRFLDDEIIAALLPAARQLAEV